jgi:plasmid stabilization system protein ParE
MKSSRKLSLSPAAEDDIRYILQYSLQTWGMQQQDADTEAMAIAIDQLGTFPSLGRAQDDVFPGCRSHPVEQHVISYRIETRRDRVLRILHAKMAAIGRVKGTE